LVFFCIFWFFSAFLPNPGLFTFGIFLEMSLTRVGKFFMGRYPCFSVVRFGSFQVRNVEVYVSVEGIWTPFSELRILVVVGFWELAILAVFLDLVFGILPDLWLVSHPMTFWLLFFALDLDHFFGASGLLS
jgi:hypothetical protein